jgi:hypothetical protein
LHVLIRVAHHNRAAIELGAGSELVVLLLLLPGSSQRSHGWRRRRRRGGAGAAAAYAVPLVDHAAADRARVREVHRLRDRKLPLVAASGGGGGGGGGGKNRAISRGRSRPLDQQDGRV